MVCLALGDLSFNVVTRRRTDEYKKIIKFI